MQDSTRHILVEALNEVAPLLPKAVSYHDTLVLWGKDGLFDSFGLVNFIASVEEIISDTLDKQITIVSEKAFSQKNSPFRSMEIFGSFIEDLLGTAE